MQTRQLRLDTANSPRRNGDGSDLADAQLVFLFGDRMHLQDPASVERARSRFPNATIVSCSSGAEIMGDDVVENGLVATAIRFDSSSVRAVVRNIDSAESSFTAGYSLARELPADGLRHVLVFAEGLKLNGSALADGLAKALPEGVSVTGGLAGDGERFQETLVGLDGPPAAGRVVAVGLYGDRLRVGMGSLGGWDNIGQPIMVTRSRDNVLHELDGEPALSVYKRLIGKHAYALPASGLLFPLHLVGETPGDDGVVRTLLSIDEKAGTITFAGDLPEGRRVQLMQANLDRLIEAAGGAASRSMQSLDSTSPEFVLLISCIGRKLLLQRRTRDELRSARTVFGDSATLAGFYSYGELSPLTPSARCELHNQTMTITTLSESAA